MINLLRKSFVIGLALAHLAAAAGYAGIEHHCLRLHHSPAAETLCCCEDQPEAAASSCPAPIPADTESSPILAASSADAGSPCCPADAARSSTEMANADPILIKPTCCEMVSLYQCIEESATPAFTALLQAPAALITVLPPVKPSAASILRCTAPPHAAEQLTLPLLI